MISWAMRDGPSKYEKGERWRLLSLSAPGLLIVVVLLVIPVGWLFALSFVAGGEWSAANFARIITYPAYLTIFKTTVVLSVVVTVACVVLGYPVAYALTLVPSRIATLGLAIITIPLWTSILVRTYAWLVLLQRRGLINSFLMDMGVLDEPLRLVHNFTGTAIGMVHVMLPYFILPLYATMRSIDRDLAPAAASCGASPIQAFWRVFFPLSLPGAMAGAVLVFIMGWGFYITPQVLGGGRVIVIAMKIQENISVYSDWGASSALGVILLVVVFLLFALAHHLRTITRTSKGEA